MKQVFAHPAHVVNISLQISQSKGQNNRLAYTCNKIIIKPYLCVKRHQKLCNLCLSYSSIAHYETETGILEFLNEPLRLHIATILDFSCKLLIVETLSREPLRTSRLGDWLLRRIIRDTCKQQKGSHGFTVVLTNETSVWRRKTSPRTSP